MMLNRKKIFPLLVFCITATLLVSIGPNDPCAQAVQPAPRNAGNVAAIQAPISGSNLELSAPIKKQIFIAMSEDALEHQGDLAEVSSPADLSDNPSVKKILRLRSVGFQDGTATSIRFNAGQPLFSVSENGRVILKNIDHVEMSVNKLALVFHRNPENQSETPVPSIDASTLLQNGKNVDSISDLLANNEKIAKQLGLAPGAKFELPNENMDTLLSDIKSAIRSETGIDDFEFTDEQIAQITGENAYVSSGTFPVFHYKSVTDPDSGSLSIDLIIDSGQERILSLDNNGDLSFNGLETIIVTEDRVAFIVPLDHANGAVVTNSDSQNTSQTEQLAVDGTTCTLHTSIRGDGSTLAVCLGPCVTGHCGFPKITPQHFIFPLSGGGIFILQALILRCDPCQ